MAEPSTAGGTPIAANTGDGSSDPLLHALPGAARHPRQVECHQQYLRAATGEGDVQDVGEDPTPTLRVRDLPHKGGGGGGARCVKCTSSAGGSEEPVPPGGG